MDFVWPFYFYPTGKITPDLDFVPNFGLGRILVNIFLAHFDPSSGPFRLRAVPDQA